MYSLVAFFTKTPVQSQLNCVSDNNMKIMLQGVIYDRGIYVISDIMLIFCSYGKT